MAADAGEQQPQQQATVKAGTAKSLGKRLLSTLTGKKRDAAAKDSKATIKSKPLLASVMGGANSRGTLTTLHRGTLSTSALPRQIPSLDQAFGIGEKEATVRAVISRPRPLQVAANNNANSPPPSSPPPPSAFAQPNSPGRRSSSQTRSSSSGFTRHHHNASTTSLASSSPHREPIRQAISFLVRELVRPPQGVAPAEWADVDDRIQPLVKAERMWSKNGPSSSSTNLTTVSGSGESRERKAFHQAVHDGYLLCQLMNKQRPGIIQRPNARPSTYARTPNVTKFLDACLTWGLASSDLFTSSDLEDSTPEACGRVAQTILAISRAANTPPLRHLTRRNRYPYGGSQSAGNIGEMGLGSFASSTPNLVHRTSSPGQRGWSPSPYGLPPVRPASPGEGSFIENELDDEHEEMVPPRPRRVSRTSSPSSLSMSPPPPRHPMRPPSISSSITTGVYGESLLGDHRDRRSSIDRDRRSSLDHRASTRYGTVRTVNTVTTAATSVLSDLPSHSDDRRSTSNSNVNAPPATKEDAAAIANGRRISGEMGRRISGEVARRTSIESPRPSMDTARRPLVDMNGRRVSGETARRTSFDISSAPDRRTSLDGPRRTSIDASSRRSAEMDRNAKALPIIPPKSSSRSSTAKPPRSTPNSSTVSRSTPSSSSPAPAPPSRSPYPPAPSSRSGSAASRTNPAPSPTPSRITPSPPSAAASAANAPNGTPDPTPSTPGLTSSSTPPGADNSPTTPRRTRNNSSLSGAVVDLTTLAEQTEDSAGSASGRDKRSAKHDGESSDAPSPPRALLQAIDVVKANSNAGHAATATLLEPSSPTSPSSPSSPVEPPSPIERGREPSVLEGPKRPSSRSPRKNSETRQAIKLGKGVWPDDFMHMIPVPLPPKRSSSSASRHQDSSSNLAAAASTSTVNLAPTTTSSSTKGANYVNPTSVIPARTASSRDGVRAALARDPRIKDPKDGYPFPAVPPRGEGSNDVAPFPSSSPFSAVALPPLRTNVTRKREDSEIGPFDMSPDEEVSTSSSSLGSPLDSPNDEVPSASEMDRLGTTPKSVAPISSWTPRKKGHGHSNSVETVVPLRGRAREPSNGTMGGGSRTPSPTGATAGGRGLSPSPSARGLSPARLGLGVSPYLLNGAGTSSNTSVPSTSSLAAPAQRRRTSSRLVPKSQTQSSLSVNNTAQTPDLENRVPYSGVALPSVLMEPGSPRGSHFRQAGAVPFPMGTPGSPPRESAMVSRSPPRLGPVPPMDSPHVISGLPPLRRESLNNNRRDSAGGGLLPPPVSFNGGMGLEPIGGSGGRSTSVDATNRRLNGNRFQSDTRGMRPGVGGRPTSFDATGDGPSNYAGGRRQRHESMVNLGSSAADLLGASGMYGSAVRHPLVVRHESGENVHYTLGPCIGRGQFGSVYRALNTATGQTVAVKRISLEGLSEEEVRQLMKEVNVLESLSHPSIVKYEGMVRDDGTLSIVLEYAENGSLGQTLKAYGKLNERLVATYVIKILEGLHYLHMSRVVHCDLKAANILTTKTGNIKLSDFGVSLNLRATEQMSNGTMKPEVAGTPNWMAPEVIELRGASTASDIWSLGCTIVELLTGRPPYAEISNTMTVMFRIVEDERPPIPDAIPPLIQDFLMQCFRKEPKERPTAEMLFEHEWLKQRWGEHKELRPQDSIPFLRRVSADLRNNDAQRGEMGGLGPIPGTPTPARTFSGVSTSTPVPEAEELSNLPAHVFIQTVFHQPIVCRVCMQQIKAKRKALFCQSCTLVAHSRCAADAPAACDMHAQALFMAQSAAAAREAAANPTYGDSPTPGSVSFASTSKPIAIPSTPNGPTHKFTESPSGSPSFSAKVKAGLRWHKATPPELQTPPPPTTFPSPRITREEPTPTKETPLTGSGRPGFKFGGRSAVIIQEDGHILRRGDRPDSVSSHSNTNSASVRSTTETLSDSTHANGTMSSGGHAPSTKADSGNGSGRDATSRASSSSVSEQHPGNVSPTPSRLKKGTRRQSDTRQSSKGGCHVQ